MTESGINNKYGFSLAEALVILLILGAVFGLILPMTISYYQKAHNVEKVKKIYSVINQSLQNASALNPDRNSWSVEEISSDGLDKFREKYLNSLKISKTVKDAMENYSPVYLNKTPTIIGSDGNYNHYFLDDGTLLNIHIGGTPDFFAMAFVIDVNGIKKPNQVGKDIFWYSYTMGDYFIIPAGYQPGKNKTREELLNNKNATNCNKEKSGTRCSALIMLDGWAIKKDYPW